MSVRRRKSRTVTLHGKEFIPSEPRGRVTLAYRGKKDLSVETFTRPELVKILDLSHNEIVDFRFLQALTELNTLIIDNNNTTSHALFPRLEKLEVLWANGNNITNLALFISTVATSFPNLLYLSMMKNEAAPSYFNGGSMKDYKDYRYYVISHIPKLIFLDDVKVSAGERDEAYRAYGPRMRTNSLRNGSSRSSKSGKKKSESTPLLEEHTL